MTENKIEDTWGKQTIPVKPWLGTAGQSRKGKYIDTWEIKIVLTSATSHLFYIIFNYN